MMDMRYRQPGQQMDMPAWAQNPGQQQRAVQYNPNQQRVSADVLPGGRMLQNQPYGGGTQAPQFQNNYYNQNQQQQTARPTPMPYFMGQQGQMGNDKPMPGGMPVDGGQRFQIDDMGSSPINQGNFGMPDQGGQNVGPTPMPYFGMPAQSQQPFAPRDPGMSAPNAYQPQRPQTPTPAYVNYLNGQNMRTFAPPGFQQTLPSMQRYNRLAPSEQQGYAGWLGDQMGVSAPDVQWLMGRLAPPTRSRFSSISGHTYLPRWAPQGGMQQSQGGQTYNNFGG